MSEVQTRFEPKGGRFRPNGAALIGSALAVKQYNFIDKSRVVSSVGRAGDS